MKEAFHILITATNAVLPIVLLLTFIAVMFSGGIVNYYYATMQKGLESRAQAMADSFNC